MRLRDTKGNKFKLEKGVIIMSNKFWKGFPFLKICLLVFKYKDKLIFFAWFGFSLYLRSAAAKFFIPFPTLKKKLTFTFFLWKYMSKIFNKIFYYWLKNKDIAWPTVIMI